MNLWAYSRLTDQWNTYNRSCSVKCKVRAIVLCAVT